MMIAFASLATAMGQFLGVGIDDPTTVIRAAKTLPRMVIGGASRSWGQHFFAPSDFDMIRFDPLEAELDEAAFPILLPHLVEELRASYRALTISAAVSGGRSLADAKTEDALHSMAGKMATIHVNGDIGKLLDLTSAAKNLGISESEVERKRDAHELLFVSQWAGQEPKYPEFQMAFGGGLAPWVQEILENTPPTFQDWPAAVWLYTNRPRPAGDPQPDRIKLLTDRNLWCPAWEIGETTTYHNTYPTTKAPRILYRAVSSDWTPFYFASGEELSERVAQRASSGVYVDPGGRFDLFRSTGHGSLYATDEAEGAWSEVLDRVLVVTWGDIAHRHVARMWFSDKKLVGDLTVRPGVEGDSNRTDTQSLAVRQFRGGREGIKAKLRTVADAHAFVLFGNSGGHTPSAAGLGLAGSSRVGGYEHKSLWRYLGRRIESFSELPVLLWRFPGDIRVR